MLTSFPWLSALIVLPLLGAGALLMQQGPKHVLRARQIALAVAILSVLLCVPLWLGFDVHHHGMQFVEQAAWLPQYHIVYHLGVDGLAMPLVVLSCVTTLLVVTSSWVSVQKNVKQYLAAFLCMQGMMVGVFCALDSVLFYMFWEALLIPMYLCIGVWGAQNRHYAAMKFFLFTLLGSVLMLVALLYLHHQTGSFLIADFYRAPLSLAVQIVLFVAFFLAFAVKVPMWPVHTWLPDAHTEAPAGGSVILAAIMLKMGVYGFLRFILPILPDASAFLAPAIITLSLIAIVYIGFVALVQTDMKRLVAYSSIAHMGFATLGCFLVYPIVQKAGQTQMALVSLEGAMVQMISHAFSSGAMFLGIGVLYDQLHTRLIRDYGGVAHKMPLFTAFAMVFAMSNVGLPGTAGFVGEFMVIMAAFKAHIGIACLAALSLILGAAYTLLMFKRVFYGPLTEGSPVNTLKDIGGTYQSVFWTLTLLVFVIGVVPECLTHVFHATTDDLLRLSLAHKV